MSEPPRIIGRYALHAKIASGGMATVHLGRLTGAVGFARTVAIKRLHPHFTEDPDFVSMFMDEARLAARIRHPNVVPTLDVVEADGELFVVMEYVQGETLARLRRTMVAKGERVPLPVAAAIFSGVLHGLHAAHEAKSERGEPLGIVHRDVSPQNIIVGVDGTARVLDFGVANASGRLQTTREGQLKGKLAYMAPEQVQGAKTTRQTDVYAAGVVLWETLTNQRLFQEENDAATLNKILAGAYPALESRVEGLPPALVDVVKRAMSLLPAQRFATAREMATALESAVPLAVAVQVGEWVERTADKALAAQAARVAEIETSPRAQLSSAPQGDETEVAIGAPVAMANERAEEGAPSVEAAPPAAPLTPPPGPVATSEEPFPDATVISEHVPVPLPVPLDEASGASQMSSISVSSPREMDEGIGRRSRLRAIVAGAMAASVLIGLVALVVRASRPSSPPPSPGTADPFAATAPPVATAAATEPVSASAVLDAAPLLPSAASTPADTTVTRRVAPPLRTQVTPPRPNPAPPPRPAPRPTATSAPKGNNIVFTDPG
jgi:eukaryotic-like serine/threonine-protein kinase